MKTDGTYETTEQPVILMKDSDVGVLLMGAILYSNPLGDATFIIVRAFRLHVYNMDALFI